MNDPDAPNRSNKNSSEDEAKRFNQSNDEDWYYVANGQKNGPIAAQMIKQLLSDRMISAETLVWRSGMPDWSILRSSELKAFVESEPPPIASQHIGNGYVWALATLPLLWAFIEAAISYSNQEAATRTIMLGFPYQPIASFPWQIPFLVNCLLGWLDDRRLQRAGYGSKWTRFFAVMVYPVYLFIRAKRLNQRPSYAISCIVCFIVGALLLASAES